MKQKIIAAICICAVIAFVIAVQYYEVGEKKATAAPQVTKPTIPPEIKNDHFALGEYYFNQPPYDFGVYDLGKAQHHYQQSIVDTIGTPRKAPMYSWYQLARVDFVQNKIDAAIAKLEEQVDVHGDAVPQVYYMLGLAYGARALEKKDSADWQRAEMSFMQFMEYAPESPWPRVDLSWVYFSQGKYAEMVPILEEALKTNSDQAWLLNAYGLALLNSGDVKSARTALQQAKKSYNSMTVEDWQQAYMDSNPNFWSRDFAQFGETIEYNLRLTEEKNSVTDVFKNIRQYIGV